MSRELLSETVSSVDRSSSGVPDDRPPSQLQQEDASSSAVEMTSDAVHSASESNLTDGPVTDEPSATDEHSSVSNASSVRHEHESTSAVSTIRL